MEGAQLTFDVSAIEGEVGRNQGALFHGLRGITELPVFSAGRSTHDFVVVREQNISQIWILAALVPNAGHKVYQLSLPAVWGRRRCFYELAHRHGSHAVACRRLQDHYGAGYYNRQPRWIWD